MSAPDGSDGSVASPPTIASSEPLLDMESAVARMLGSRPLYFSMLDMFRSQLLIDMEGVQEALGSGDQKEALRLIHSTKGAAKILGAERLGAMTDLAYDAVRSGEPDLVAASVSALLSCAAATLTAVDELIKTASV